MFFYFLKIMEKMTLICSISHIPLNGRRYLNEFCQYNYFEDVMANPDKAMRIKFGYYFNQCTYTDCSYMIGKKLSFQLVQIALVMGEKIFKYLKKMKKYKVQ